MAVYHTHTRRKDRFWRSSRAHTQPPNLIAHMVGTHFQAHKVGGKKRTQKMYLKIVVAVPTFHDCAHFAEQKLDLIITTDVEFATVKVVGEH